MAIKATVFKAELAVSDMDRHYYQTHELIIARHPSENDARMMMRLLAFALNANEQLSFTRGLSADDEPELWQKSLSGEIDVWIELGQPDEKRIRKACSLSKQVIIYTYQPRAAEVWWQQIKAKLSRFDNLVVYGVSEQIVEQLSGMAERTMRLQCTIDGGDCWLSDSSVSLEVMLERWG